MKYNHHDHRAWLSGAICLFLPAIAAANETTPTTDNVQNTQANYKSPPRYGNVELGLRTDFGLSNVDAPDSSFAPLVGLFVGAEVLYRPIPYLGIGGYAAASIISSELGEGCIYGNRSCRPVAFRFGATLRAEPLPKSVVGPWLGVGLAALTSNEGHSAVNLEGTLGVDFRTRRMSIGPYLSGSYFINISARAGLRVAFRF